MIKILLLLTTFLSFSDQYTTLINKRIGTLLESTRTISESNAKYFIQDSLKMATDKGLDQNIFLEKLNAKIKAKIAFIDDEIKDCKKFIRNNAIQIGACILTGAAGAAIYLYGSSEYNQVASRATRSGITIVYHYYGSWYTIELVDADRYCQPIDSYRILNDLYEYDSVQGIGICTAMVSICLAALTHLKRNEVKVELANEINKYNKLCILRDEIQKTNSPAES